MLPHASNPSSTSLSPCDVFATACELKTQLATLERRCAENAKVGNELRQRRTELQVSLRALEVAVDDEQKATRELRDELERLRRAAGESVTPFTFTFPTKRTEENEDAQATLNKPTRRFARHVIPEQWKKQLGRAIASNVKGYVRLRDGGAPTKENEVKARKMRRILSEKVRESGWKVKQHKARKENKPYGAHLARKKASLLA
ncbi:uncharacterized protein PHACADRAFT_100911 [Phanerochaete carnosa HHB-10118-sp]|uniref:Uncharacterized protein n=1 Tax=Phanerochaete carnosa (strain HHB-10118-sp) TaxID=650164 RepID=K5WQZ1_PHACS|nr:uncharacterized protein PHACADRAFT_100911 [Phanerochaete carnosa HHB-10118-sp]EKM52782.1 hypothetical protein PHACADRAFT_100911 [Phanerochaete carnosa HHB-10118-sp]